MSHGGLCITASQGLGWAGKGPPRWAPSCHLPFGSSCKRLDQVGGICPLTTACGLELTETVQGSLCPVSAGCLPLRAVNQERVRDPTTAWPPQCLLSRCPGQGSAESRGAARPSASRARCHITEAPLNSSRVLRPRDSPPWAHPDWCQSLLFSCSWEEGGVHRLSSGGHMGPPHRGPGLPVQLLLREGP